VLDITCGNNVHVKKRSIQFLPSLEFVNFQLFDIMFFPSLPVYA